MTSRSKQCDLRHYTFVPELIVYQKLNRNFVRAVLTPLRDNLRSVYTGISENIIAKSLHLHIDL